MKRSDKYLMEDTSTTKTNKKLSKKYNKKKSKKSKNKLSYSSSDSDCEEPKQMHIVNTVIEMPEGAILSDSEDKDRNYDPNDPHRALDIDLEM